MRTCSLEKCSTLLTVLFEPPPKTCRSAARDLRDEDLTVVCIPRVIECHYEGRMPSGRMSGDACSDQTHTIALAGMRKMDAGQIWSR